MKSNDNEYRSTKKYNDINTLFLIREILHFQRSKDRSVN
uniref:Uncharacterized protein n=1 Tax=Anguilla anguilla TaxID=7936 RepID=A0A0E9U1T8_ANGAN